ncbi:hypothetical protein ACPB9J_15880 [Streptomyces lavendulocolor]|uniref:hypothetical protein n=1 Tax=Streptomyces lavendulocolor TaxID=67316 RepID=UPI003C2ACADD
MVIPASTVEYIHVTVTASPSAVSLTGTPPRFALVTHRTNPTTGEWKTGDWADATTARILAGPGTDLPLTAGTDYRLWINIDPPGAESVVRKAGTVSAT